jgi:thiamine-phosphate pyrophosphorylase
MSACDKKPIRQQVARALNDLKLYLITDRSLFSTTRAFLSAVERALQGGVRALQLREKGLTDAALLDLARTLRALTHDHDARLFINGRPDIARQTGADGVHLPEQNRPNGHEVKLHFPELRIGASTHGLDGALRAEAEGADFVTFGPVFDTPSKRAYGPPLGLDALRAATLRLGIPALALGGVKTHNVPSVLQAGAFGVALITGIWKATDIKLETSTYIRLLGGSKP